MADELTTFPLSDPISLYIRVGHGQLRISAQEGLHEATVRLTPRAGATILLERMTVELHEGRLSITGPRQGGLPDLLRGWMRDHDSVDVAVDVPVGTPMTVAFASGDIAVTGRCGDADITFATGRVDVAEVAGDLRVRYASGDTRVGSVAGAVRVGAADGDLAFGAVAGSLHVRLGRGDLRVDDVRGRVHARNGHGALRLNAVHDAVDVMTGAGSIDVGLPPGVVAKVDASSGQGQVHSSLPVAASPPTAGRSILVRARTGRGDIRLHRPEVAAA